MMALTGMVTRYTGRFVRGAVLDRCFGGSIVKGAQGSRFSKVLSTHNDICEFASLQSRRCSGVIPWLMNTACRPSPVSSSAGRCNGMLPWSRNTAHGFCSLGAQTETKTVVSYVSDGACSNIEMEVELNDDMRLKQDPPGYINLVMLFDKHQDLCFECTNSFNLTHCFSSFALDIFKKLFAIADGKGQDAGMHFHFEPSEILVKWDSKSTLVEKVAIPASQFRNGTSVYMDRVVGPLMSLVCSLFNSRLLATDYKELFHLIDAAQNQRLTAQEVLSHPFFWTPEEKFAAIMACKIFGTPASQNISNPLSATKGRTRVLIGFNMVIENKDFFNVAYNLSMSKNRECQVTETTVPATMIWEQLFIGISFPPNYCTHTGKAAVSVAAGQCIHGKTGVFVGAGQGVTMRMVTFIRNILGHFGDANMDAYASTLTSGTLKIAVLDLDRKFSICLTVYHGLRQQKIAAEIKPLEVTF